VAFWDLEPCGYYFPHLQNIYSDISVATGIPDPTSSEFWSSSGYYYFDGVRVTTLTNVPNFANGMWYADSGSGDHLDAIYQSTNGLAAMHRVTVWTTNGTKLVDRLLDKYVFFERSC